MKISEMDKKVDILLKTQADGPFGSSYSDFTTNIWAKKEQLIGTQIIQAMGESDRTPCNFIVRRNDTITNKMYVKHGTTMYDIKSAVPLPKNDAYTILTCFEVI